MDEIFSKILGYENYIASSYGRILNTNYSRTGNTKELSYHNYRGYRRVTISKDGKSKTMPVHLLVMRAFHGYIPKDRNIVINHIDNNSLNNSLDNLEIVTSRYNSSCHQYLNKKRSSEFIGVSWDLKRRKWKASINHLNKSHYLGYFENEIDASKEYNRVLDKLNCDGVMDIHSPFSIKKTSKYIGVSWNKHKQKWVSQIYWNKNQLYLGKFNTEEEAFNARCNFINNNKPCK